MIDLAKIRRFLLAPSKKRRRILVLAFGLIGFVLPAVYGYVNGFPIPHIHDEFGYILAGDTFAHGRLTNPTPAAWESFEAPHILLRPSYMSKYPPAQGLFLAAGQVLFGNQVFGIWLSCGFAAAALYWMLCGWTRPKWAFFGTLLMIGLIGIQGYWAQSFWGGMAAAGGGALFFGGFRRLFKNLTAGSTVLMTLGGIILVNSRPFEGTMTMLPALFVLFVWVLRDKNYPVRQKIARLVLPGVVLTGLALSSMAYYNYRLTGIPLRFAYTEHQTQYFATPLFIFQSPSDSPLQGTPRLKKLYRFLNTSSLIRDLEEFELPRKVYLYPVYAVVFLHVFIPYSLLGAPLLIFLFVAAPLLYSNKWSRLIISTIVFTILCMSLATYWDCVHYAAPLTSCYFLLVAEGLRYFIGSRKIRAQRTTAIWLLVFIVAASAVYRWQDESKQKFVPQPIPEINLNSPQTVEYAIPEKLTFLKPAIEEAARRRPDNFLMIVSYDKNFSFHDEIVFNRAEPESSKLIWAVDLGPEKNAGLIARYKNRKVLYIDVNRTQIAIRPYTN